MKINHWGRARQFIKEHANAEAPLIAWTKSVIEAEWKNFPDVKTTFNSADWYEGALIFAIGGNSFRLIAICRSKLDRISFLFHKFSNWHGASNSPQQPS